jgi:hypothetical protein
VTWSGASQKHDQVFKTYEPPQDVFEYYEGNVQGSGYYFTPVRDCSPEESGCEEQMPSLSRAGIDRGKAGTLLRGDLMRKLGDINKLPAVSASVVTSMDSFAARAIEIGLSPNECKQRVRECWRFCWRVPEPRARLACFAACGAMYGICRRIPGVSEASAFGSDAGSIIGFDSIE